MAIPVRFQMVPTCSHCGKEVKPTEMRPRRGPGATGEQRDRAHRQAEREKARAA